MAKTFPGGAGYRSRYLSHAKRALYHLSYAPRPYESDFYACDNNSPPKKYLQVNSVNSKFIFNGLINNHSRNTELGMTDPVLGGWLEIGKSLNLHFERWVGEHEALKKWQSAHSESLNKAPTWRLIKKTFFKSFFVNWASNQLIVSEVRKVSQ